MVPLSAILVGGEFVPVRGGFCDRPEAMIRQKEILGLFRYASGIGTVRFQRTLGS